MSKISSLFVPLLVSLHSERIHQMFSLKITKTDNSFNMAAN